MMHAMAKNAERSLRVVVAFSERQAPASLKTWLERNRRSFEGWALLLCGSDSESLEQAKTALARVDRSLSLHTLLLPQGSTGEQAVSILLAVRNLLPPTMTAAEPWVFVDAFPVGLYESLLKCFSQSFDAVPGVRRPRPFSPPATAASTRLEPFEHKRPSAPLEWQDWWFLIDLFDDEEKEAVIEAVTFPRSVLITGDRGTGKSLLARYIHFHCQQTATGPFVPCTFAAVPPTNVDDQLRGVGRYTGVTPRPGLLEEANNGTLFLDEIAETPKEVQAKLLDYVSNRIGPIGFIRLGETEVRRSSVRFIAATNVPLGELGTRLRQDLHSRFPIRIHLKGVYEKTGDPADYCLRAIKHFSAIELADNPALLPEWDEQAIREAVRLRHVPGNLRDLHNAVARILHQRRCGRAAPSELVTREEILQAFVSAVGERRPESNVHSRVCGVGVLRRILADSGIAVPQEELAALRDEDIKDIIYRLRLLALNLARAYGGTNEAKARRVYGMSNPKSYKRLCQDPKRLHPDSPRRKT